MRVFIIWLFRLLVTVLLIVIVVPLAGTLLLDQDDYKSAVSGWVESRIGRPLEIGGRLGIRLDPGLILFTEDIRLENVDWSDRQDALRIARLEARISLRNLLQGRVVVEHVLVRDADLLVEQGPSGQFNFGRDRDSPAGVDPPAAAPAWLDIRSVAFEQVRMHYDLKWRDWDVEIDQATVASDEPDAPLEVDLQGSLNTVPIRITGTLGTAASWLERRVSDGDLTMVAAGEHSIRATGTVGDVLGWRDLDVRLEGGISRLRDIGPWFRYRPLDLDSVRLSAHLLQPGTLSTMRLENLTGQAGYRGIPFHASGTVGRLSRLAEINLNVSARDRWDVSGLPLGDVTKLSPTIEVDAVLTGATYRLRADISRLVVTAAGLTITAQGQVDNASRLWESGLPLELAVEDVQGLGRAMGRTWPATGGLRGDAVLHRDKSGYVLEDIRLQTTGGLLALSGEGRIQAIGRVPAGNLEISGAVQHGFFTRNGWVSFLHPEVADVQASWRLSGSDHRLEVERLLLQFPGGELHGRGDIPDLGSPGALVLGLEGSLWDAGAFGAAHGVEWPEMPELQLGGTLHGDGAGNWRLENLGISGSQETERLSIVGGIHFPRGRAVPDLQVEAAIRPDALGPWLRQWPAGDTLIGELGPIHAQFDLGAGAEGTVALKNIRMTSTWTGAALTVVGEVPSWNPLQGGLDVSLSGKPAKLLDFSALWLPIMEQVDLDFSVTLPWDGNGLERFRLKARAQDGSLDLQGDILNLKPFGFDKLHLAAEFGDLAELVPPTWKIMPGNPLSLEALLQMDAGVITANGSARVGESGIEGTVGWHASRDGGRPMLDAVVQIDQLDMKTLFHPGEKTPRVFPLTPLLPEWMLKMDGSLAVEVADYWGRTTHFRDLRFDAGMDAGSVESEFEAHLGEGVLSGAIRIPKDGETQVELVVSGLPAESLRTLAKGNAFTGGVIDADIMLRGSERSLAGLVDRGQGQVRLEIRQSRIYGRELGVVGGDLVTNFLSAANLFDRNKDFADVECGVLYLDIGEGKAVTQNGLALKTDRVTILGGGQISFPDEEIDLYLTPKAREGLGISAGSIARVIRLGGTLRSPEIEADPKGLLASGLNLGAAIISGGVTLVALGLFDRFHANSDVCGIARGEKKLVGGGLGKPPDQVNEK